MRKIKKVLVLCIALMMLAALFVGCKPAETNQDDTAQQDQQSDDATSEEATSEETGSEETGTEEKTLKPFKIGCYDLSCHGPAAACYQLNMERMVEIAGGEMVYVPIQVTTDGIIDMVEQWIAAGVDGLMFMPTSDAVLPPVAKLCEEAGVYFSTVYRPVRDPEVLEILEQNPYYCGYTTEDEIGAAYEVGKYLAELGMTKVACINLAVGDTAGDDRDIGIQMAAEEFGFEIVAEARAMVDAADTTKTCESFMAAYPDLDGMINLATYAVGGVDAMATAISNAGKEDEILLGTCDFFQSQQEWFDKGVIKIGRGGHNLIDNFMTLANVVNSVMGTPIGEDGPIYITCANAYCYNGDDLAEWFSYTDSGELVVFSDEEIKTKILKWFNPEITEESFLQFAADWGFEYFRSKQ